MLHYNMLHYNMLSYNMLSYTLRHYVVFTASVCFCSDVADSYIKISTTLGQAAMADGTKLTTYVPSASFSIVDKGQLLSFQLV